jgi:hypothetical protein
MADTKKNTTAAADIPADASTNTTEKKAPVKKAAAKKTTAKKESAASEKSAKKTAKTTKKTTKKTTAKTAAAAKKAEPAEEKAVQQPAADDVKKTAAAGETAEKAVPAVKEKAEVAVKEKGEVAVKEKAEVAVVEEPKKETKAKAVKAKKETKAAASKTKKETKAKAEEAKKAEPVKEVKAEPKTAAVKEEAKAEVKAAPVKEEPKAAPVKEEAKAAPVKEEPAKEEAKVEDEAKKAEKAKHYNSFELNTVEEMARAMGVKKSQDELRSILLTEADLDKVTADLIAEANLNKDAFDFEEDGYDIDLIPVYVQRVAETMDFKASDYQKLADEINAQLDFVMTSDAQVNADEYQILFELVKKVLMLAQQKDIHSLAELEQIIPADLKALVVKFMDVAYDILKNWQYNDCKFYEGFIFAVLSQFEDIFAELNNRAMMDVSDLYIVHGDFGLGDANYEYILRENQLKDYIYFRFANIYRDIDRNKAKAIASGALRYVDGRFDYYPNIIEILES